jgi:hypothetical protein
MSPFPTPAEARARAAQSRRTPDTEGGSFLGQLVADPVPPFRPAQRDWLDTLLARAELPPLAAEVSNG